MGSHQLDQEVQHSDGENNIKSVERKTPQNCLRSARHDDSVSNLFNLVNYKIIGLSPNSRSNSNGYMKTDFQ